MELVFVPPYFLTADEVGVMTSEVNGLVYTLGASTRSPKDFIELLTSHGVEVVVDVRRFP